MNVFKLFALVALLQTLSAQGQDVVREYYDIAKTKVKYEYQIDNSTRAKNGPYKSFSTVGALYEAGSYKMGKKHGEWKGYDEGGSGQVTSIMTFTEGAMNGLYKQWCFSAGKMYLCRDSYYRDDVEVRTKLYYPNGQLQKELDTDRGILNQYFEDGKPEEETINGVHYSYFQTEAGARLVTSMRIDTLPCAVRYEFEPYRRGNLTTIDLCTTGSAEFRRFDFNSMSKPAYLAGKDGKKLPLDSSLAAEAFKAYLAAPNPNGSNIKIEYNLQGDMTLRDPNGAYSVTHYYPTGTRREMRFSETGKPLSDQELDSDDRLVGVSRSYKNGTLSFVEDKRTGDEQGYYSTGAIEYDKSRSKGYYKQFYESGKPKSEKGLDAKGNECCYNREFDTEGRLVSEHVNRSEGFVEHWRTYDGGGRIVKVVLDYGGQTYETPAEVADFLFKGYGREFKSVYTKQVHTTDGVLTEYPKGEDLFRRSTKVLEDIVKRYDVSSDEANKQAAVSDYKRTVERLLVLAQGDTAALNTEVSKLKKVEEIRKVLGLD